MEKEILHTELISRKQKLMDTAFKLKTKFLGLDNIIDEVISLMMPWYLFPETQIRPTVINLWGLTGSGKTALVQSLVELLEYRRLFAHLDMGEFESDSASWVKSILTDDLEFFDQKPALICLDEFQFARTLDAYNNELGKDKLRVVWDLLDSGKLEYTPGHNTHYLFRADACLKRIEKLLEANVMIENGEVATNLESFEKIFYGFYFNYNDRYNLVIDKAYFLSQDFIDGMFFLFDSEDFTREDIKERVRATSLIGLKHLLIQGMCARPATKTMDLSRSIIFVLGNLDEAFTMSHSMNPDISADEFHEQTSRITVADIKRALRKRFRPEQIARLGNNHVIYTSFNNAQFRLLIKQELNRVGTFVTMKFGWRISFDESVVNIVYAEGVFPAQGTRPVLTTIKNLVEARLSNLIVTVLEYQLTVAEILWVYENGHFIYTIKDQEGNTASVIPDPVRLKLENLRKSVDPEIQAHTAVHEAGHAILAALTLRIVPPVVVSRTASEAEGFCLVNFPKGPMTRETLRKDIVITLGGLVAEKMIFGQQFTSSGVSADIEEASALANKAIRRFAMGTDPILLAVNATQNEDAFALTERYAAEALKIIHECEEEAASILQRNKLLLLKMAQYLTINSKMEEAMIGQFVKKYAQDDWVRTEGFIKKEDYYKFNSIVEREVKALETAQVDSMIENLLASKENVF
ncbi:MAG: hypothetical protein ACOYXT_12310 [Bacteroidota bacterium]